MHSSNNARSKPAAQLQKRQPVLKFVPNCLWHVFEQKKRNEVTIDFGFLRPRCAVCILSLQPPQANAVVKLLT